jgi:hypothetical protein
MGKDMQRKGGKWECGIEEKRAREREREKREASGNVE